MGREARATRRRRLEALAGAPARQIVGAAVARWLAARPRLVALALLVAVGLVVAASGYAGHRLGALVGWWTR